MNSEWIKDHFTNYEKANNSENVMGQKITISIHETMLAIDRMGKNKATSTDELMDVIFQVREWKNLEKRMEERGEKRQN